MARVQLNPALIDDHVCTGYLARYPRLNWSIQQVRANLSNGAWDVMGDLGEATLLRAAWSKRQVFEVMVEFWSNHLNVTNPSSDVWDNRHDYDKNVIRKYAFGRFSDMLWASANHPAMMRYLNNADSAPPDFNENYGRELLELHTVGVDGGYTEVDMRNSALIMSGYGVHDPWPSDANTGIFEYIPDNHYVGPVTVMGFSHANSTAAGGYAVGKARTLAYLATHPSTARRIADKLITRFVSDEPHPGLSKQLAATYLANGTAIVPVLKQLFTSRDFGYAVGTQRYAARSRTSWPACAPSRSLPTPVPGTMACRPCGGRPTASASNRWPGTCPTATRTRLPTGSRPTGTLERWNIHMALAGQWWPIKQRSRQPDAPGTAARHPASGHAAGHVRRLRRRALAAAGLPDARAGVSGRGACLHGQERR